MLLFLQNLLDLLLEAAPWLVLGFTLGGLIKALIPTSFLQKHLSANSVGAVGKAAVLGAPLPLCSCGVIPVALGLRQAGASKPATTSFLVATPETGIDSISITYALLGPFMAIVRPIAALSSAVVSGLLIIFFDKEKPAQQTTSDCTSEPTKESSCCSAPLEETKVESCCATKESKPTTKPVMIESCCESKIEETEKSTCVAVPEKKNNTCCESSKEEIVISCCSSEVPKETISCCSSQPEKQSQTWVQKAVEGVRYSFTNLLDDIIIWLMVGMLFAALANTFLPADFLAQWGQGLFAMIIMVFAGIPMYICATASTPVAAGLMMAGVSPGVALVLMLTGPATNISTLGVIQREMGQRTMVLYLIGVVVTAITAGLIVNALVGAFAINIHTEMGEHGMASLWLQWLSLLLLAGFALRRWLPLQTS